MTRLHKRYLSMISAALVVPLCAACDAQGNDPQDDIKSIVTPSAERTQQGEAADPSEQVEPAQQAQPDEPPPPTPLALSHEWTFEVEEGDGYVVVGSIEIGDPLPASEPVVNDSLVAGSACTLDPATDAVIPARISVANDTEGFAVETVLQLIRSQPPTLPLGTLAVEMGYSDGPSCRSDFGDSIANTIGVRYQLDEGETSSTPLFFVLHNFYSPDYPDGNYDRLGEIELALGPQTPSGKMRVFDGPEVGPLNAFVGGLFPLHPTT